MNNLIDLLIVGAGPAGLMAAKTAATLGLKVTLIEKNKDFKHIKRACSSQFIMDDGYEDECLKIANKKLIFQKNNFEVNYDGALVDIKNKYYNSPKGHRIHFAHKTGEPFALKFDKQKLLDDLRKECEDLGVEIKMGTLAYSGRDNNDYVSLKLKDKYGHFSLNAKKLIIAEGVNAHLTEVFGFNKDRTHFATAHVLKYILKNVSGIEPNSWNLYYGKSYFSNAAIIIGPSLYGNDVLELTISGDKTLKPDAIYKDLIKYSPLKKQLEHSKLIDKQGCTVKAFSSLKTPYNGNVLVIGDSSAFVEVEVQGALMCGYHAANAIKSELEDEIGFEDYTLWWNKSFEFNSDDYLKVSQGYALVPTYSDDELDYLFSLIEGQVLEGTYSQYKTPKLIWDSILVNEEKIQTEKPLLFEKIKKMNQLTLSDTFKI